MPKTFKTELTPTDKTVQGLAHVLLMDVANECGPPIPLRGKGSDRDMTGHEVIAAKKMFSLGEFYGISRDRMERAATWVEVAEMILKAVEAGTPPGETK